MPGGEEMRRPVPRFRSRTERTNGAQEFGEATASLERFGEMVEITVASACGERGALRGSDSGSSGR